MVACFLYLQNGVNPLSPEDIEKQKAELEILVNVS